MDRNTEKTGANNTDIGNIEFACRRCGNCCRGDGYVWVNAAAIDAIAGYLQFTTINFAARYLRQIEQRYSLMDNHNGDCIFFAYDQGCLIYPVRPEQCRNFPFWNDHPDQQMLRQMWRQCPGIEFAGE